jgi:hypothetical protein
VAVMFKPSTTCEGFVREVVDEPLLSDPPRQPAINVGNSRAPNTRCGGLFNMMGNVSGSGFFDLL